MIPRLLPLTVVVAFTLGACGTSADPTPAPSPTSTGDEGANALEQAGASWRSTLYPEDWSPDFTHESGAFLHDVSYAGYHRSEDPIAKIPGPLFDVVADFGGDSKGEADATAAIQGAIDAAGTAGGGVVYFQPGLYRVDGQLTIRHDHVILRGNERNDTQIYFTLSEGMSHKSHITFQGSHRITHELPLVADGISRSHTLQVEDASAFSVGDDVSVGWIITDDFVEEHGMTGTWQAFNGTWQPFFWREVMAIDATASPHTITLDVPLRYPTLVRDGASIRRIEGTLSEVGVERLSLGNATDWETAWGNNQVHVLAFHQVKDAWLREVGTFSPPTAPQSGRGEGSHLQSSGLLIKLSKRMTVDDVHLAKSEHRGGGGNGYLFEIRQSSEILTQVSSGREGRHNFIQNWGFGTSGCVWRKIFSEGGRVYQSMNNPIPWVGFSEFHHSLAMANLIEQSRLNDGFSIQNRMDWSSGAGHTGTESTFWNNEGRGFLQSFQYGTGHVIGTDPRLKVRVELRDPGAVGTAPVDWLEGKGQAEGLEPESLFYDQLSRRLATSGR